MESNTMEALMEFKIIDIPEEVKMKTTSYGRFLTAVENLNNEKCIEVPRQTIKYKKINCLVNYLNTILRGRKKSFRVGATEKYGQVLFFRRYARTAV